MSTIGKVLQFTRGLRFRLALSYVFFFTILLVLLGIVFRQTLSATFQSQMRSVLEEEWGVAKSILRTGPSGPDWFYDEEDPDESFVVRRLQRVYLLADTEGHALQHSVIYDSIGLDSPAEIKAILKSGQAVTRIRTDKDGIPYMIRSGLMIDERRNR